MLQQAENLLFQDELTGLCNRRYYNQRLLPGVAEAAAEGRPIAFLLVDLDWFKSINDRFGHSAGDRMLQHAAQLLRDVVGEQGIPVRYAGDEFCILIPNADSEQAMQVATRLCEAGRSHPAELARDRELVPVSMSIGVAAYPEHTQDAGGLFDLADRAVYLAKQRGRGQAACFEPDEAARLDSQALYRNFPCPQLIGRGPLVSRLADALFPGVDRRLAMVLLQGPSGVGKSRLLHEVRGLADPQRLDLLSAGGVPYLVSQPFGLLIEALGSHLRTDPQDGALLVESLQPAERAAVARLLPELSRHLLLEDVQANASEADLPRAFAVMLTTMARRKALLVLLDDFQWADPGTLATLTLVCQIADQDSLALLLAMRAEGLDEVTDEATSAREAPLRDFLARMLRSNHLATFPVPLLGRAEVEAMVSVILPLLDQHAEVALTAWRKSRGLPLLVEEILRFLVVQGCVVPREDGRGLVFTPPPGGIPNQAEELLRAQTQSLDQDMRERLARAAALGQEFEISTMRDLEREDEGFLRGILEDACRLGLLQEKSDGDSYEFVSESARQALERSVPDEERKATHARIASLQEEKLGGRVDSEVAELAWHYAEAGDDEDAERVLDVAHTRYREFSGTSEVLLVGKVSSLAERLATRRLTDEEMKAGMEMARQFRVTMRTGRMYGPEAEQAREQLASFHQSLGEFLESVPNLEFSQAGEMILINGSPVPGGGRLPSMSILLEDAQIKGLAFKRGVTAAELEVLMRSMMHRKSEMAALGGLGKLLRDQDVRHVVPNEMIFVHVGEQDVVVTQKSGETIVMKDLDSLREVMGEDDMALELEGESGEFARAQRTGAGGGSPDAGGFAGPAPTAAAPASTAGALSQDEIRELRRIQEQVKAWYAEVQKYLDLKFLDEISADWTVLSQDLESGSRVKVAAASKAFLERGQDSVERLMSLVALTDDVRARKVALTLLKKLAPNPSLELVRRLFNTASDDERVRLIAATEDLEGGAELAARLSAFVASQDARVRRAAIEALARFDRQALERALLEALLPDRPVEVRRDAADGLGRHGVSSARAALASLCRRRSIFFPEENARVQESACIALGRLGGPGTAAVLVGALQRTGVFWRTKPSEVRAAAALGLAHAGPSGAGMDVSKLLEEHTRDRDGVVRQAAGVALGMLRGRR